MSTDTATTDAAVLAALGRYAAAVRETRRMKSEVDASIGAAKDHAYDSWRDAENAEFAPLVALRAAILAAGAGAGGDADE